MISSCKNYQELSDLTNFDKEAMISWNIGLKNPLAKYLSEYDNKTIIINNSDRIAQGELIRDLSYNIEEISSPPEQKTNREGGFGSTGV